MRILVLAPHTYYTDRGTPIDVDILVRALSARGEHVDLLVYADGEDRAYPHVTIHRPVMPNGLHGIGPGFSWRKVRADWHLFRYAGKLVRENHYDVVHAGEESVFMAIWFKLTRRLPYIYDMDSSIAQQTVEQMPWLKPVAWLLNFLEARAVRSAMAAAPVCNALGDLAEKHGAAHVAILHDISQLRDPDRRPSGELRRRLGLDDNPILMYVGNLEEYQGVDLLLKAFAIAVRQRKAEAHLVIAGGTKQDIEQYRAKAAQLGIAERTHFLGPWPMDRLDELLAEADILTAPRIKGINTPMKVFPYLHSGTPTLLTALPTHTQVLTGDVAMLARANPENFAEAIEQLSRDADLRARLGAAGRAFVERNHTWPVHERRVNELYDHVVQHLNQRREVS